MLGGYLILNKITSILVEKFVNLQISVVLRKQI